MKVVIYTNEYPPNIYGGAGVHVDYLSRELRRLINVEVRCFGDQHADADHLRVRGHGPWPELIDEAPGPIGKALGPFSVNLMWAAQKFDSNLVHCHTWYSMMGGVLAKLLHEVPLVVTTHSLEPLRPWKREQLGTGYNLTRFMEQTGMAMADAIIAVSRGTRDDILRVYDVDPQKIHVIHNGIDAVEYCKSDRDIAREKYGIALDSPYVLFVGRITRQKGIIHLVEAIESIDSDAQVVLCAGAPDTPEIGREMEAKVRAIQTKRANVIWIAEMVSKPDVIELYSHAAVFCCPSIYEPFGIINLEAMACETAVVASKIGGIPEAVVDGETGILVPVALDDTPEANPKDPAQYAADLAEAVNRVLRSPDLQARFGQAGRRRVEQQFTWAAIAQQTVELYKRLIERGAS